MKGTRYRDHHGYPEEKPSISKLEFDKAQTVSESFKRIDSGGIKTISKFLFPAADKTGQKVLLKNLHLSRNGTENIFK